MEVRFVLTQEDYWSLLTYRVFHSRPSGMALIMILGGTTVLLLTPLSNDQPYLPQILPWLVVLLLGLLFPLLWLRRLAARSAEGGREQCITITPEDYRTRTPLNDSTMSWRAIKAIEQDQQHFYVLVQAMETRALIGQIIPKRAFATTHEAATFLEQARRYWREAQGIAAPHAPGSLPDEGQEPPAARQP